jgi:hypothetical protein
MENRRKPAPPAAALDINCDCKEYVLDYLEHSFPVQLYEPYSDRDGNLHSRPVRDLAGNIVINREALRRRRAMIERLAALPPIPGALDQIVQHFGPDAVAEVTGRSRRIVPKKDVDGNLRFAVESRPGSANLAEVQTFMEDAKRILVFSEAGGTGRSYHADLSVKNQRLRIHYGLEFGWKSDNAVQGFGRDHRTNQKQPPRYRPVSTNVKGQKRFISTIARRLDSLGAITRGQRQTGGQNMFRPEDNLESWYAHDALRQFYGLLARGKIEGCSLGRFEEATGLASEIARRLADSAEAFCRRFLSNGRREGRYWLVGNVHNAPGRSLYVRLVASVDGRGQAGKWTDANTGEHGDLLDIIAATCAHTSMRETLDEARHFLSMPLPPPSDSGKRARRSPKAPTGTPKASRRLWAATRPLIGSIAGVYLGGRALRKLSDCTALRFHPHCYYRPSSEDAPDVRSAWPALIAAVTDNAGTVTGVHRTWLDPENADKAPVAYPRRAMGHLLGHGVRIGASGPVMAAGEGIETIASLHEIAPAMPLIAGLSAAHLAAIRFPCGLRRLYVARDNDPAGDGAFKALVERAEPEGIEVVPLEPRLDDFNSDLRRFGPDRLAAAVRVQLVAADAARFLRG